MTARPQDGGGSGWRTLARHQMGAVISTAVDFGVMIAVVESGIGGPVVATMVGAFSGALTNFTLGRRWIFAATQERVPGQVLRYALVSGGSLALNAAGEGAAVGRGLQYLVARMLVAGLVSIFWNYPLHRFFVFRRRGAVS